MKKFIMLAVATLLCCAFAFAASQSQTPYEKGKYYGKSIVILAFEGDEVESNSLIYKMESYIENNLETENDFIQFINGLRRGMRDACKDIGLDEEQTEEIIEVFNNSLIEELLS